VDTLNAIIHRFAIKYHHHKRGAEGTVTEEGAETAAYGSAGTGRTEVVGKGGGLFPTSLGRGCRAYPIPSKKESESRSYALKTAFLIEFGHFG
jgi:hypothetical protein